MSTPATSRPLVRKASGRSVHSSIAFSVCAILAAGCGRVDEIRRYQVPRTQTTASANDVEPSAGITPSRMLGAIILHGGTAWFFKATGPEETVAEQVAAFRDLVKSVRFVDSKPQWTLPDGWREKPSSGIRFSTLEFGPDDTAVELSITQLGIFGDDTDAYVLSNVNRWRVQMQLPEVGVEELDQHAERIELEDGVATLVDLVGQPKSGGMGRFR